MEKISQNELTEILHSYNISDLSFDEAKQVDPDTMIYIFHDEKKYRTYC